jgi:threonine/homoserine/homoserine lactone efflux protein
MELLIVGGISMGFLAGMQPGPFQTYVISAALSLGWRRGIVAIFAPLIADIPIILVVVFVLGQALPPAAKLVLRIVGGLFLLWLAYKTWKQLRAGVTIGGKASDTASHSPLKRAVLMILLSPGPYIAWSTFNGALLLQGLEQSPFHAIAFLAAFYVTFLSLLALLVIVFDRLRRLDERITRAILYLTVLLLVGFGLLFILQGAGVIES